jgi:signal transduction histidine kinase
MLVNLIGNAIKFTLEGGTVRAGVENSTRNGVEGVLFRVTDTGMGIPREALPRMFERFYQVDHALSRKFGGTGLGLAISRMIVEAHGGDIWVESELGKGSSFYAFIPFEREKRDAGSAEEEMDVPTGGT